MKKRGVGMAAAFYPTGMSGGGDPSQAIVKVKTDGSADLIVGSVDIGQGCKTVLAQIAAEVLGISYDQVNVINGDTNICPNCLGTFASRVTYVAGNAVIQAAQEARDILFEVAAEDLGVEPEELEAAEGKIFVRSDSTRAVSIADIADKTTSAHKKLIVGRGHYMRDPSQPDPETGAVDPFATLSWGAVVAEIEVDTETGEVEIIKLVNAYDAGRAINPLLVEGQIEGGAAMAIGAAMMEQLNPYYPSMEWQPETFGDYVIPTALDIPELQSVIRETLSLEGPFGAKGIGEMTANIASPAIVNAFYDATGVWINELPLTPEKVLKALQKSS
ncbi:MAG: xanthine dehydrogenase family protein molybdopterin-binding subunit [Dethiobacteria bacterium]|jgi:CO/xanthine dehydrogenase Mo-binding subunit